MRTDKTLNITDHISFESVADVQEPQHKSGMWAKTEVVVGYGEVHAGGPNEKAWMDEPKYKKHNTVVIGGVQYTMEKLFNVTGPATIPTLYSATKRSLPDSAPINTKENGADEGIEFYTPEYTVADSATENSSWVSVADPVYRTGHFVQLFGVGITGSGESDTTVYPVDYRESGIDLTKNSSQVNTVTGTMYPFRYTQDTLSNTDKAKYFGKIQATVSTGSVAEEKAATPATAYYLKKFESTPVIKHIYSSQDPDVETVVTSNEIYATSTQTASVETFTEMILKISAKDLKEYFIAIDQPNKTRLNTIALYSGRYVPAADNAVNDFGDFEDVRMFSKIVIDMEHLSLSKDLNIIYRVYGS